jgi:4-hydroxy-tetrahydrodipicolinate synthase
VACKIWNSGLVQLHEYVADMGRLHVRNQTATWLHGLIPNPFLRPTMPRRRQIEMDTIYELLNNLGLSVIDRRDGVINGSATAASVK